MRNLITIERCDNGFIVRDKSTEEVVWDDVGVFEAVGGGDFEEHAALVGALRRIVCIFNLAGSKHDKSKISIELEERKDE